MEFWSATTESWKSDELKAKKSKITDVIIMIGIKT